MTHVRGHNQQIITSAGKFASCFSSLLSLLQSVPSILCSDTSSSLDPASHGEREAEQDWRLSPEEQLLPLVSTVNQVSLRRANNDGRLIREILTPEREKVRGGYTARCAGKREQHEE